MVHSLPITPPVEHPWATIVVLLGAAVVFGAILALSYRTFERASGDNRASLFYILVVFPSFLNGFLAGFVNEMAVPLLMLDCIFFAAFVKYRSLLRSPQETRLI